MILPVTFKDPNVFGVTVVSIYIGREFCFVLIHPVSNISTNETLRILHVTLLHYRGTWDFFSSYPSDGFEISTKVFSMDFASYFSWNVKSEMGSSIFGNATDVVIWEHKGVNSIDSSSRDTSNERGR